MRLRRDWARLEETGRDWTRLAETETRRVETWTCQGQDWPRLDETGRLLTKRDAPDQATLLAANLAQISVRTSSYFSPRWRHVHSQMFLEMINAS